jgi:hypothetical protein
MKKTYVVPKLMNHGTVGDITAWSKDSTTKDFFFGPPGGTTTVSTDQGSYDACFIPRGEKQCK